MKNVEKDSITSIDVHSRNVIWTMEPDARLRMAEGKELPQTVVIFEEIVPPTADDPKLSGAARRQLFLLLCLLLTSVLAYLVFSGQVKF